MGYVGGKGTRCESVTITVAVYTECYCFRRRKAVIGKLRRQKTVMTLFKDTVLVGRPAMMLFRMGMIFLLAKKRIITGIVSCGNFLMLRKLPQLF